MKRIFKSTVFTTGLAIFAMFFGAGNLVLPIALGIASGSYAFYAIVGFLLTGVAFPVIGLAATVLFDGDYKSFFYRLGPVAGFVLITLIMALIGPFAAIPRCIALAHTTLSMFLPQISLVTFSIASAVIIFLFSIRENQLLEIFGKVLSPLKLICLVSIIVLGFFNTPAMLTPDFSKASFFIDGLYSGYQTMDLLGAIFFSALVVMLLRRSLHPSIASDYKKIAMITFKAGLLASGLLALVYGGFAIVAAKWGSELTGLTLDQTIGALAFKILGTFGGIFASVTVSLTCLTTAITLAVIFTEFLQHEILKKRVSYFYSLIATLIVTTIFAVMGFERILSIMGPLLVLCYPSIIMLAIVNIAYKLYGFDWVKLPVALTFAATIGIVYFERICVACACVLGYC